ncbi:similar to Saccharomyces cerevisiae YJL042W MHP1 Microtubule-associated protein involved in assembly and stabilization of microtubules [Maudiozyma saulgeensis]|uniref:Similar to Saccharomyces cerevisiae YJL042W MHP1 Microtubule-associated protein involved in assembly and stabilization of microtubules n=1 Tax=Maudiozyma saulgeensis TaxID=1789683 RepID=A0A1X7R562_9SACH|nr:similar to Saccharomyces cerevisiae YJL042W MHP1 Microtubule-associated protein involved in assembly and stabilization of microtubules [Kazachstania saulgeensis]
MDPREVTDETLREHHVPRLDVGWFASSKECMLPIQQQQNNNISATVPELHTASNTTVDIRQSNAPRRNSVAGMMREFTPPENTVGVVEDDQKFRPNIEQSNRIQQPQLRRTKSISEQTAYSKAKQQRQQQQQQEDGNGGSPKKMGFFKSLFGRKRQEQKTSGISTSERKNTKSPTRRSRRNSMAPEEDIEQSTNITSPVTRNSHHSLTRAKTESDLKDMNSKGDTSSHHHHHHHTHLHSHSISHKDNLTNDTNIETDDSIANQSNENENENEINDDDVLASACDSIDDSVSELDEDNKRLLEFLKYYKSKGYAVSAFKQSNSRQLHHARTKATFTMNEENNQKKPLKLNYDARGRPIPPHPQKSSWPSAFLNKTSSYGECGLASMDSQSQLTSSLNNNGTTGSTSNKFGAFLKRVTSHGANANTASDGSLDKSTSTISSSNLQERHKFDPANFEVLPGLEDLKPLKHVSFSTNTYFNDPPQQICSKNPRKGEVEVKPNGSVVIHRLTPQERRKILQESTAGIVVGGTGQLKLLVPQDDNNNNNDNDNDNGDSTNQRQSNLDVKKLEEKVPENILSGGSTSDSTKDNTNDNNDDDEEEETANEVQSTHIRNMELAAAEAAAEARAKETPNDLRRTVTNHEEEVCVSKSASHLTIDKPMVSRRSLTNLTSSNSNTSLQSAGSEEIDEAVFPPKDLKIPHDVVYTRCCHLREILPIPATMKQLTPGSTDPIPLLQLRNPRPSMVEVWSFSDFISIAPILCLSLDGVHLTVEMLRIILGSLSRKKNFEKLSLRNTPLDEEGWKVLCYFVSHSESLVSLDLTMVSHIKVNVQKPSKSSLKSTLHRMDYNKDSRSEMNWNLLAGALAVKGGIEELILSGAKMSLKQFKNFIEIGAMKSSRLGLAYNQLSLEQCQILAKWIVHSRVTGLDIGFNDLRGKIQPFSDAMFDKIHAMKHKNLVKFISLNNTNLQVEEGATSETNEFLKLLSILCFSKSMKFLDLSNNPKIFPACMHTLLDCLPSFVGLARLHLNYNDLTSTEIVTIAETLPLCTSLHHLSMVGTPLDLASSKALAEAVKKSTSLITLDLDYVYMPEKIKDEISLYSMRNIQSELTNPNNSKDKNENIDKIAKSSNENSQLQSIRDEFTTLLTETFDESNKDEYNATVEKFIVKVSKGRRKIRRVVQDLFDLRIQGELNIEGKEALIRLCIIDASLEKSIRLLRQRHSKTIQGNTTTSSRNGTLDDLTQINSSESQLGKNENRSDAIIMSSAFTKAGHSVLLPFGSIKPENSTNKADEMVEFRDDDAPMKRLVEPEIIRRENTDMGSDQAEESEDDNQSAEMESINSDKRKFSESYRDKICKAAETSNSDQIKDMLLKNNVSDVLNVIDELHNQGFHFHHIFKKQDCKKINESQNDSSEDSKTILPPSLVIASNEAEAHKEKIGDTLPKNAKEIADYTNNQEEEAMNHAYDQVLDNLVKIRVSNKNLADSPDNIK